MRKIVMGAEALAIGITALMMLGPAQASADHVSCGDTITQDTKLDSDLIDCPGHGIVIGADNITLDLNGHLIDGVTAYRNGVDNSGFRDVVIRNGTIREFDRAGVFVFRASGNVVTGLTVTRNPHIGIQVAYSTDNLIEDNVVSENRPVANNFGSGIGVYFGSDNRVRRNVTFNNNQGITVVGEERSEVGHNSLRNDSLACGCTNSIVTNNSLVGGGMRLGLINSRIEHNSVSDSRFDGMRVLFSSDGRIENNSVTGAGEFGIVLEDSGPNNHVESNSTSGNGASGIALDRGSYRNTIEKNRVFDNGTAGITVGVPESSPRTPEDNLITQNFVFDNTTDGIQIRKGVNTYVARNFLSHNGSDGIQVRGIICPACIPSVIGTLIEDNFARQNGDDGIEIDGVRSTVQTTLTRNSANRNVDLGIEAAVGVTDGGGNRAIGNGNPLQCLNIVCTP